MSEHPKKNDSTPLTPEFQIDDTGWVAESFTLFQRQVFSIASRFLEEAQAVEFTEQSVSGARFGMFFFDGVLDQVGLDRWLAQILVLVEEQCRRLHLGAILAAEGNSNNERKR